jgi:hypothetical protein
MLRGIVLKAMKDLQTKSVGEKRLIPGRCIVEKKYVNKQYIFYKNITNHAVSFGHQ